MKMFWADLGSFISSSEVAHWLSCSDPATAWPVIIL